MRARRHSSHALSRARERAGRALNTALNARALQACMLGSGCRESGGGGGGGEEEERALRAGGGGRLRARTSRAAFSFCASGSSRSSPAI